MIKSAYSTSGGRTDQAQPRRSSWLDGVQMALQRLGFVAGSRHVLVVPGHRSGIAGSALVTVHRVEEQRYVVEGENPGKWVQDARMAGHGRLCRGRMEEHVSLAELTLPERIDLLRHPAMAAIVTQLYGRSLPAEELVSLAARTTVFRLERC